MNILIMKLCFVFVVIIAILWMKRPLFWAISGGLAAALVLYGIRVPDALSIMGSPGQQGYDYSGPELLLYHLPPAYAGTQEPLKAGRTVLKLAV